MMNMKSRSVKKFIAYAAAMLHVSGANAATMCKISTAPDWLAAFQSSGDNSVLGESVNHGWGNSWAAMYNSKLIEGIAMCIGSASDPSSQGYGRYCWCRMIRPVIGSSWVLEFTYATNVECYPNCAVYCAYCVMRGTHGGHSCTRSALLAS